MPQHLLINPDEIGKYVLLPGDPARVSEIANYLQDSFFVSQNREFTIYSGKISNEKVLVVSTGIGGPSTAIAVEELVRYGAHTLIRVGTSGILQRKISNNELIIVNGAVRDEGTSLQYLPIEFPAISNYEVVSSLVMAANQLNLDYHLGICHSKDALYSAEKVIKSRPFADKMLSNLKTWIQAGVLCSDMETASLLVVSSVLDVRAGSVLLALKRSKINYDNLYKLAITSLEILIQKDQGEF